MSKQLIRSLSFVCLLLGPLAAYASGTLFWDCEATTFGSGSFSAGDTTATANGGITISNTSPLKGSNSCLTTDGSDYFILDSASIATNTEGAFGILFRWSTTAPVNAAFAHPLGAKDSADDDNAGFSTNTSSKPVLFLRKEAAAAVKLTMTTALAPDTTYYMTGGFDIAGDRRFIRLYNGTTCALIEEMVDTATDLSVNPPGAFNQVRIGNATSQTPVLRVDTVVWASDYDDPVADACAWAQYKPTFSGVSNGTFTSTTLPFNYTTDHNGTTWWAACTNGQTVTTFANLKSGTCSGGAAIGTASDAAVAGVANSATIPSLASNTTYDVYYGNEDSLGWQSDVNNLADRTTAAAGGLEFSTPPSITPATNGYTCAGKLTGSGTLTAYCVACALGDEDPNATEIKAGQCGGGNSAVLSGSEVWTTNVPNDFVISAASKPPIFNVFMVGSDGSTNTTVSKFAAQARSPRSGKQIVFSTAIGSTSAPFNDTNAFAPDFAVNDSVEVDLTTRENANCNIGLSAAMLFSIVPAVSEPTACDGRITWAADFGDTSTLTGVFTTPSAGNFTTSKLLCNGNTPPEVIENSTGIVYLIKNAAAPSQDISASFNYIGTGTVTITSGTLPTGLTLTNNVVTGTPTVEDETVGATVEYTLTDECGDSEVIERTYFITDNVIAAPNCVNGTPTACVAALAAVRPWVDSGNQLVATFSYDAVIVSGNIISQTPTSGNSMTAIDPLQAVVSLGVAPVGGLNKKTPRLGLGVH